MKDGKEGKLSLNQIPRKERKYSDNSGVKKPPAFLMSPKGQDSRNMSMTPKPKMNIGRFKILK